MLANCLRHFETTLSILEPTLIVLQGGLVAKSAAAALPVVRTRGEHLYETSFGEHRALVCAFSHPSAQGAMRWGDTLWSPYLTDVVAPTLRRAVRLV
jgi:uracil-DNA glycosylase